jgi:hypothetical protein
MEAYCYSYEEQTMVFMHRDIESMRLFRFLGVEETEKLPDPHGKLNHQAVGTPGVMKQLREIVIVYARASDQNDITPTISIENDIALGLGASVVTDAVTLRSQSPTPHLVQVGGEAGLCNQWWMEYTENTDGAEWAIEGLVARYEPLVDRTGSRST